MGSAVHTVADDASVRRVAQAAATHRDNNFMTVPPLSFVVLWVNCNFSVLHFIALEWSSC